MPLVAITGTLDGIVSLFISTVLYLTWQRSRSRAHRSFTLFYLFIGLFFITFAGPQLVINDGVGIGVASVASYFFLYLSFGYLLSFPFQLDRRETAARVVFAAMLLFNLAFLAIRITHFSPSVAESFAEYSYWRPVYPEWMRVLTGLVAAGTCGTVSTYIITHGWRNRLVPYIYYRSLWLGSGVASLVAAALLGFIAAPTGSAAFVLTATILVLAGLLAALQGLLYRTNVRESLTTNANP